MSKINSLFKTTFILLLAIAGATPAIAEDEATAKLFAAQGIEGTLVLSALKSGQTFVHNTARAKQRFPVASTFKIMNTLIAVQEQVIAGKDDVLRWNGQIYDFSDWNRDQTLASAFKVSCVWCYQELAKRIGAEKYRELLRAANFGELHESFELTTFWLDGSLQISAEEQIAFLRKVYLRTLPFSAFAYDTLRDIMLVEKTPTYALRAKTGWAARNEPQIGWYVGYVETDHDIWFFATNIQLRGTDDLPLRQQLTKAALAAKGIIE